MMRAVFLIVAGAIISRLGRGRARDFFELAGDILVLVGIADVIYSAVTRHH